MLRHLILFLTLLQLAFAPVADAARYLVSGGEAANVNASSSYAVSAFQNNYLTAVQVKALTAALEECRADFGDGGCDDVFEHFEQLSKINRTEMLECTTPQCWEDHRAAMNAGLEEINRMPSFVQDVGVDGLIGSGQNFARDEFFESSSQNSNRITTSLSGQDFTSYGEAYCGGVYDAICMSSFATTANFETGVQSAMIGVGVASVATAGLVFGPQLAAACLASPTCYAAYQAIETAGNASDLAACGIGKDPISCGIVALNALTPGNFADEIVDTARSADLIPEGVGTSSASIDDAAEGGQGIFAGQGDELWDEQIDALDATNRTLPSGSPYSQADYDKYVQLKLDAGETPRSPENYIAIRQQFDRINEQHNLASADTQAQFQNQGFNVQTEVTLCGTGSSCRADQVISRPSANGAQVPEGYTATDLDGNQLDVIPLNLNGQAVIEIKTGNAGLTGNQSSVGQPPRVGPCSRLVHVGPLV